MGYDISSMFISPNMAAKIGSKHGISRDDVLDACSRVVRAGWVEDDRGRRLFVEGLNAHGRLVLVVLYPTGDPGAWNLGTALFG